MEFNTKPFKFTSKNGTNFIEIDEKYIASKKENQLRKIKLEQLKKVNAIKRKRELIQKKKINRRRRRNSNLKLIY